MGGASHNTLLSWKKSTYIYFILLECHHYFFCLYLDGIHPKCVVIIPVKFFCLHDILGYLQTMLVCYWPIIGFNLTQNPIPLHYCVGHPTLISGSCWISTLLSYLENSTGLESFISFIKTQYVDAYFHCTQTPSCVFLNPLLFA